MYRPLTGLHQSHTHNEHTVSIIHWRTFRHIHLSHYTSAQYSTAHPHIDFFFDIFFTFSVCRDLFLDMVASLCPVRSTSFLLHPWIQWHFLISCFFCISGILFLHLKFKKFTGRRNGTDIHADTLGFISLGLRDFCLCPTSGRIWLLYFNWWKMALLFK